MKKFLSLFLGIALCLAFVSGCKQASTQKPVKSADAVTTSGVVAESSNVISDKEKQAVLISLTNELDAMLDDLNNADDIDDADLVTDDIN